MTINTVDNQMLLGKIITTVVAQFALFYLFCIHTKKNLSIYILWSKQQKKKMVQEVHVPSSVLIPASSLPCCVRNLPSVNLVAGEILINNEAVSRLV